MAQEGNLTDTRRWIRLFDVDPGFARLLGPEERREVDRLAVPVVDLPAGEIDTPELLESHNALAGVILEGMLAQRIRVGESETLRILGPGDVLGVAGGEASAVAWSSPTTLAAVPTSVAILGTTFLEALRRWPGLVHGLQSRLLTQSERAAAQLAICQLPRVSDRLLAMLWFLAESWGQVTNSGVTLPIALTHETIGALIGARRPTVTLAVGDLVEEGAIVRRGRGWLLVRSLPMPESPRGPVDLPSLDPPVDDGWLSSRSEHPANLDSGEMRATLARLHDQLERMHEDAQRQIDAARAVREQVRRRRDRPAAPPSGHPMAASS